MLSILKDFIASFFYIIPSQKRVNKICLETASNNLKAYKNRNKKRVISGIKKTMIVDKISMEILKDYRYLNMNRIVERIRSSFNESDLSVFITGSYGSHDFVKGWSDLDVVVIILSDDEKKIEQIFKRLYRLNSFLYRDDIFQHHGFLFLHYTDFYDDKRYFPFEVLTHGMCAFGNSKIEFSPTSELVDFSYIRQFFEQNQFEDIKDLYTLKNYIHQITIFPCYYYQSKGNVLYKKEAISRFVQEFPQFESIYRASSDIRFLWPNLDYLKAIKSNNVLFIRTIRKVISRLHYRKIRNLKLEFSILSQASQLMDLINNEK